MTDLYDSDLDSGNPVKPPHQRQVLLQRAEVDERNKRAEKENEVNQQLAANSLKSIALNAVNKAKTLL